MSSCRFSRSAGNGPRAGKVSTFIGHRTGIAHSTASHGMSVATDTSLGIDLFVWVGDDFGFERQHLGAGEDRPVKGKLHPAFAHEGAGILGIVEMATQLSAARKNGMPESAHRSKTAEHRVTDLCGLGGEVRFADRAVQKRSGWNEFSGRAWVRTGTMKKERRLGTGSGGA